MQLPNPFAAPGLWFKGNTHTHTTNSDGALGPEKTCAHYAAAGYDFLFITDHGKVTDVAPLSTEKLTVFSGEELDVGKSELGNTFHIVALGLKQSLACGVSVDPQQSIAAAMAQGALTIIAHPYWSQLTVRDMLGLSGPVGFEVYNTSCEYSISKGISIVWWDEMLYRGNVMWGLAADDAHFHFNEHRPVDICGAWIILKAESLTQENVLAAIRTGDFYASTGPEIQCVTISEGVIRVDCSPARLINFISNNGRGERFTAPFEERLTRADYKIRGPEKYIRIEVVDYQGKIAWTNPVYVK